MSPLNPSDTAIFPLSLENLSFPVGIDFDPFEERIYWTDYSKGTVMRSSIDGSNQETIHERVRQPWGIALDLGGGNVYWINRGNMTIEVSKLNGDYWKVLVYNLSSAPYDIALDTIRG